MTQIGVILGTAAYMSPEQARGVEVDQRSDVWAFGCVLYEMLTGRRAFPGSGVTETLAAILEREVDWSRLPASTPPGVRTLLRRALAKDPRRRLHHIADARLELEEAHASPERTHTTSRRTPWLWIAGASIALIAVVVGTWRLVSASLSGATVPSARLSIVPEPGLSARAEGVLAMSPDGRHIVYVSAGDDMLYVRDIDRFDARALPGTEGADTPVFSPDGQWIAFFANRKVKKVALAGGAPLTLADVDDEARGLGWESDASILFNQGRVAGIWRVPATGGSRQQVTKLRGGENSHRDPEGLPGGQAILYGNNTGPGTPEIYAESLSTGERHFVDRGTNPHYVRSGHIVYVQDGSLMIAPFDVGRLEKTGSASVALAGVRQTPVGTAQIALSQTGSMAYVPAGSGGRRDTVVWVDSSGGGEQLTTVTGEAFSMPRLAPDSRRIAIAIGASSALQGNQGDLWMADLERGVRSRVTADGLSTFPLWDPGGRRLLLSSGKSGTYQLLMKTLDGTAPDTPITSERGTNYPLSWSPDGRFIATVSIDANTANDIWVLTLGDPRGWRPFTNKPFREGAPTFSHDSRLIAYASDESGRSEIYVKPYPGPGEAVPVSTDGGSEPLFARGAPTLFYRRGDEVIVVDITTGPPIEVGTARRVSARPYNRSNGYWPNYDVTPDGRRLLMIRGTAQEAPSRVNVVLNWLDASRAPAN